MANGDASEPSPLSGSRGEPLVGVAGLTAPRGVRGSAPLGLRPSARARIYSSWEVLMQKNYPSLFSLLLCLSVFGIDSVSAQPRTPGAPIGPPGAAVTTAPLVDMYPADAVLCGGFLSETTGPVAGTDDGVVITRAVRFALRAGTTEDSDPVFFAFTGSDQKPSILERFRPNEQLWPFVLAPGWALAVHVSRPGTAARYYWMGYVQKGGHCPTSARTLPANS
jgi:hypothetical protein